MTKIKKIEVKTGTYQGKPKTSYIATLEDGVNGYFNVKDPNEFKEGDDIEYTKEVKKSSSGKDYNLLTFKKVQPSAAQTTPTPAKEGMEKKSIVLDPKDIFNAKVHAVLKALELANKDYQLDKIPFEKIAEHNQEYLAYLLGGIDECRTE